MNIEVILLNVIYFLIVFLLVFVVEFYFIGRTKSGKKKVFKITNEGSYLIYKFNLDEKKINIKMINFQISLINGFIIAFVSTTISITKFKLVIQLLIAFVLLFSLIYSIYEIYGRCLKKKWGKNTK